MSYLVLARKYRPQTFAEVLEQGHITRTLGNALSAGRVAHAILFAGPRGTGKTTIARILAKALNCQAGPAAAPCNQCRSCSDITAGRAVDVYEIDGASNNSVDQVRELRETIKYMPAHSPYKIYIIDEVHMLSTPAFNALLKTLEEPPAHVLFMFATTEPHKIPITILSRCQRFDLRRIRFSSIAGHLTAVCRNEGVEVAAESLELIARESGGSVRDSLSLLDQVISGGQRTISHEQIIETLGVIDRSQLHELAGALLAGDVLPFLATLDDIFDRGHDLKRLFSDLLEYLRDLWVIQTSRSPGKLVDLPNHEIERMQDQAGRIPKFMLEHVLDILFREEAAIRFSLQPKLALEMVFFKVLQTRAVLSIDTLITKLDDLRREVQGAGAVPPPLTREQPREASGGQGTPNARSGRDRSDPPAPPQAARRPGFDPDGRYGGGLAAGRGTRRRHPAQPGGHVEAVLHQTRGGGTGGDRRLGQFFRRRDAEARQTHGDSQEGLRRDLRRHSGSGGRGRGGVQRIDPRAPRSQPGAGPGDAESSGGRRRHRNLQRQARGCHDIQGGGQMKGMGDMMKQAQKLQARMLKMQEELAEKTVESAVGGGMIKVVANGRQQIVSIRIEKEVVDPEDVDMLQDLMLAAVNDALAKSQEMVSSEMGKLTGGLKLPGLM